MTNETIYHAAVPADWIAAREVGIYRVSTRGQTLDEVGFIHASYKPQLAPVANHFYADLDWLTLLVIDPARLDVEVIVEPPFPGSDERFPHIYGPLPVDAVVETVEWRRGDDGLWALPAELA